MYCRASFTQVQERQLVADIRAAKVEGNEVERSFIVEHAVQYHPQYIRTHFV